MEKDDVVLMLADSKTINPPGVKRSEIRIKEVLCSEKDFAVAKMENGKFVAITPGHSTVVEDEAELRTILNSYEQQLLDFRVNR